MPTSKPLPPPARRQLSWPKRLLFSLLPTVLFFVLAELTLRLAGTPPSVVPDPYVGFSSQVPLMQVSRDPAGREVVGVQANKRVWFNDQQFPLHKPADTTRVFCVGGSTTFGRPFSDATSYSGWLRELLPRIDPSQDWEIINAGGISYASYRVAAVMEELARYEPDLFIVYSAHNEFLERRTYHDMFAQSNVRLQAHGLLTQTRIWGLIDRLIHGDQADGETRSSEDPNQIEILPAEVDEMLNHSIGPTDYQRDDEWQRKVLYHYELNLTRMVSIARRSGAQIMFVTPASNEKDCSPFRSESTIRDPALLEQVEASLSVAAATNGLPPQELLDALQRACDLDPRNALANFALGKVQLRRQDFDSARASFAAAIREDICPLRADRRISDAIDRVVRQHQTLVVDFESRLRSKCRRETGNPCLGREYFLDHVHPTIDVHGELAGWIVEAMQADGLVSDSNPATASERTASAFAEVSTIIKQRISPSARGVARRNLAKVFHWSGKYAEASRYAREALALLDQDPESQFILADCLANMGQTRQALDQYAQLYEQVDVFPRGYLPYGELLVARGQLARAKAYLTLSVTAYPEQPRGHYQLGRVHLELREFELAADSLQTANRLYPHDPVVTSALADAWVGQGDYDRAINTLEQQLAHDSTNAALHYQLGMLYLRTKNIAQSITQFNAVIALDPTHQTAVANLAIAKSLQTQQDRSP